MEETEAKQRGPGMFAMIIATEIKKLTTSGLLELQTVRV